MKRITRFTLATLLCLSSVFPAAAQDKDIFNFAAQKAAPKGVKRIVFVADPGTHGAKGNHEFTAGAMYDASITRTRLGWVKPETLVQEDRPMEAARARATTAVKAPPVQ